MFNSHLKQAFAITAIGLRSVPKRPGPSSITLVGVACVIAVFTVVMAMLAGFQKTMLSAGAQDTVVVLRSGATSELLSSLRQQQTKLVANLDSVKKQDGQPLSSAELYVIVDVPSRNADVTVNVPIRGVQAMAFHIRDNIKLVEGRMFVPGKRELVVGKTAMQHFAGLELGNELTFDQNQWRVVGIFEDQGSVSESEIWTAVTDLQSAFRRHFFQSMRVKLAAHEGAFEQFQQALANNPRLNLSVQKEIDYFASQSQGLKALIEGIGYPVSIIMAIGALFGVINTMYSSIEARAKQTATLRALGFGTFSISVSIIVESMVLSLVGGLLGGLLVYGGLNGYAVSSFNSETFSQVVFQLDVNQTIIVSGIWLAVLIGFIGGVLPSIRSARQDLVATLRS
jgi:putative ABC transport system permease protein